MKKWWQLAFCPWPCSPPSPAACKPPRRLHPPSHPKGRPPPRWSTPSRRRKTGCSRCPTSRGIPPRMGKAFIFPAVGFSPTMTRNPSQKFPCAPRAAAPTLTRAVAPIWRTMCKVLSPIRAIGMCWRWKDPTRRCCGKSTPRPTSAPSCAAFRPSTTRRPITSPPALSPTATPICI